MDSGDRTSISLSDSALAADQAWFWTERWQRMESEADADIAAGRVVRFESAEDFIADLVTASEARAH